MSGPILIGRGLDQQKKNQGFNSGKSELIYAVVNVQEKRIFTLKRVIYTISGGNGVEDPPVPIPNTEVKLNSAEGTWLDTARETRSLPDFIS